MLLSLTTAPTTLFTNSSLTDARKLVKDSLLISNLDCLYLGTWSTSVLYFIITVVQPNGYQMYQRVEGWSVDLVMYGLS